MGRTNATGRVVTSSAGYMFGLFDQLPAAVRRVLSEANRNYDPALILQNWRTNRRGRTPEKFAADMIAFLREVEERENG